MPLIVQMMINYYLVVGIGRSGTTLLLREIGRLANAHPIPEISFLKSYLWKETPKISSSLIANLQTINLSFNQFKSLLGSDEPISEFRSHLGLSARTSIIEKDSRHIFRLDLIQKVAPCTKLILIIRDPADVFLSRRAANWSNKRWPAFDFLFCFYQQWLISKFIKKHHTQCKVIHYEDLISLPTDHLSELFPELGLPSMLKNKVSIFANEHDAQWKTKIHEPISSENKNKWYSMNSNLILIFAKFYEIFPETRAYTKNYNSSAVLSSPLNHWKCLYFMISRLTFFMLPLAHLSIKILLRFRNT